MRARLSFLVRYYLFWVVLFAAARLLFMLYYHSRTAALGASLALGAMLHGLRMDLSAAGYLTAIPALLLTVSAWSPLDSVRRLIAVYSWVAIAVVSLLTVGDLGIFEAWGFRLDATPLQFVRTPHEMLISTESAPILPLALILLSFTLVAALLFRFAVRPAAGNDAAATRGGRAFTRGIADCAVMLLATALLVIPIRGGLQWTPLNQSSVYFSSNEFANQAALNVEWNFVRSLTYSRKAPESNPYTGVSASEARSVVDSLVAIGSGRPASLLRISRPNVILLIWESLTAKVVGRLGGVSGVTPSLDSLSHQGILFDSLYASGDRSAQGLVAILSGFPTLPHVQIMNTPNKAATLPSLSGGFDDAGYTTSFYYGGELAFANIKAYLINSHFDRIIGEAAFAKSDRNSKWGAHDHVVLGRLLSDVPGLPRPFFTTIFTLSSHEPFEIPTAPRFPGSDIERKFLSAHAYTDRSVGDFIRAAQREPWWDSTLVVIVGDHGHPLPRVHPGDGEQASARYHIPMLWLGGALAVRDTVVHRIGSQTDIAPTLLDQLHFASDDFRWGRDLFASGADGASFAYFSYLDGFGFVDQRGRLVYDAIGGRVTQRAGRAGPPEVRAGLSWLRGAYQSYLDR
ncbi:MAG TPA: sulfatase-like hydrolase/transferase [Gemmatimonadaceae bacterium]|nr:sulfatase-like hydrolase/transferase [Gemmatimonadaceae bacterium]